MVGWSVETNHYVGGGTSTAVYIHSCLYYVSENMLQSYNCFVTDNNNIKNNKQYKMFFP